MYFFFAFSSILAQSIFLPAATAAAEGALGASAFAASASGRPASRRLQSAAMLIETPQRSDRQLRDSRKFRHGAPLNGYPSDAVRMIQDARVTSFFAPDQLPGSHA
jgi:hypothetical protein